MSNLVVNADVYNVEFSRKDDPSEVVADTNVLYWLFYPHAADLKELDNPPLPYQLERYAKWWKRVRCRLLTTMLNMTELANCIERVELELLWRFDSTVNCDVSGPSDRNFCKKVRQAFHTKIGDSRDAVLVSMEKAKQDTSLISFSCDRAERYKLWTEEWGTSISDCTDSYMVACAKHNSKKAILSDDADIASCKDIRLYTANKRVIEAAKKLGKLR